MKGASLLKNENIVECITDWIDSCEDINVIRRIIRLSESRYEKLYRENIKPMTEKDYDQLMRALGWDHDLAR